MAIPWQRVFAWVALAAIVGGCLLHADSGRRRRRRILERGRPVRGWIVQANDRLFGPGSPDLPALVLVSFEPKSNAKVAALARRLYALKSEPPADEVEADVARLVRNEAYQPGARHRLPAAFTDGLEVYAAHVMVRRGLLPGRRLEGDFLHCRAEPGESGEVLMSAPPGADDSWTG